MYVSVQFFFVSFGHLNMHFIPLCVGVPSVTVVGLVIFWIDFGTKILSIYLLAYNVLSKNRPEITRRHSARSRAKARVNATSRALGAFYETPSVKLQLTDL